MGGNSRAIRILLTVGGHPRKLPIPGCELALSFRDLRTMEDLPKRVSGVGGSATGCQLASIMLDFGAQVDLIQAADRLAPSCDADVSCGLETAFVARGMNVLTAARSEEITAKDGRFSVAYQRGGNRLSLETDAVFLMVGWPANVGSLHVDLAGISMRGPYIGVDEYLRTNVPEIFVAGDANGISMLVQRALLQGGVARQNAVLGSTWTYSPRAVATGSFTNPEYGAVGLTEEQARASHDCVVEVVRYDRLRERSSTRGSMACANSSLTERPAPCLARTCSDRIPPR